VAIDKGDMDEVAVELPTNADEGQVGGHAWVASLWTRVDTAAGNHHHGGSRRLGERRWMGNSHGEELGADLRGLMAREEMLYS